MNFKVGAMTTKSAHTISPQCRFQQCPQPAN
jgi:hypothetical protein